MVLEADFFDAEFFLTQIYIRFRTVFPTVYPQLSWWEVGGDLRPPIKIGDRQDFFASQKIKNRDNPRRKKALRSNKYIPRRK